MRSLPPQCERFAREPRGPHWRASTRHRAIVCALGVVTAARNGDAACIAAMHTRLASTPLSAQTHIFYGFGASHRVGVGPAAREKLHDSSARRLESVVRVPRNAPVLSTSLMDLCHGSRARATENEHLATSRLALVRIWGEE